MKTTKENYEKIKATIMQKNPECKLLAVSKGKSIQKIEELQNLGQKAFGENRAQELLEKAETIKGAEWHFIGNLQSNKVKKVVEIAEAIHSVSSIKILEKIDFTAKELGKKQKVFLEVNVSGEKSKHGFSERGLEEAVTEARALKNVELLGLMTMAPYVEAEETRKHFKKMKELAQKHSLKELSMGMSNDFEVAIEEGATIVRIGTKIFEN
jgi:PLP dependent protein